MHNAGKTSGSNPAIIDQSCSCWTAVRPELVCLKMLPSASEAHRHVQSLLSIGVAFYSWAGCTWACHMPRTHITLLWHLHLQITPPRSMPPAAARPCRRWRASCSLSRSSICANALPDKHILLQRFVRRQHQTGAYYNQLNDRLASLSSCSSFSFFL